MISPTLESESTPPSTLNAEQRGLLSALADKLTELSQIDFTFVSRPAKRGEVAKVKKTNGQSLEKYAGLAKKEGGKNEITEAQWDSLKNLREDLRKINPILDKLLSGQRHTGNTADIAIAVKLIEQLIIKGVLSIHYLEETSMRDVNNHIKRVHREIIAILRKSAKKVTSMELSTIVNDLASRDKTPDKDLLVNLLHFIVQADKPVDLELAELILNKLEMIENWNFSQAQLVKKFLTASKPFLPFDDSSDLSAKRDAILSKLSILN